MKQLPDKLIDKLIDVLSEMRTITADVTGIAYQLESEAHEEWTRRYPNTIPPCLHKRMKERGGFPPCYRGPAKTVDLETEQ